MSDTESNAPVAHATLGGKSLASIERPLYKSWRKKFRKMHGKFNGALEDNKRLFREEQRLEGIARRLKEELDGLLELCLDLNQSPALPPELRFDVSLPQEHTAVASIRNVVPPNITPESANELFAEYTAAVQRGQIPQLDLHVIREQIDQKLAAQEVVALDALEAQVPHAVLPHSSTDEASIPSSGAAPLPLLPDELASDEPAGLLTSEQEDAYLLRLDGPNGGGGAAPGDQQQQTSSATLTSTPSGKQKDGLAVAAADDKHWAEFTPREVERQIELQNPQSQHNWLKAHAKPGGAAGVEIDDTESLASHEARPAAPAAKGGKRNLARQVGDRAVERAREGLSPGAYSAAGFGDEDELAFVDDHPGSGSGGGSGSAKKRGRGGGGDADGTYRVKGGKAAGGAGRGKRKRAGSEDQAGMKKSKTEPAAA